MNAQPGPAMNELTLRLMRLSTAEEFLEFFGSPYEQAVVNVSRLHILKRLFQYLRRESDLDALDEATLYTRYRALLQRSYTDFVTSTPAKEKVFKVLRDAQGAAVPLSSLRDTLPSARGE